MNTQTTIQGKRVNAVELRSFRDDVHYPESHDEDIGESSFHYKMISYLFGALEAFFSKDKSVMIAANMNLYYEEGNPQKYFTPDLMVAFGAGKSERQVYKLWKENVFPQVVFEIASERTWKNDIGEKSEFYSYSGTDEYYLIDVERKYLPLPLMAYRRQADRLQYIPLEQNRILSPLLNLEIVDTGKSFRIFNPQTKEFLQAILTGRSSL